MHPEKLLRTVFCRTRKSGTEYATPLHALVDSRGDLATITLTPGITLRARDVLDNVEGSQSFDLGKWHLAEREELQRTIKAQIEEDAVQDANTPVGDRFVSPRIPSAPPQGPVSHPSTVLPMNHRRLGWKDKEAAALSPDEYKRVLAFNIHKDKYKPQE